MRKILSTALTAALLFSSFAITESDQPLLFASDPQETAESNEITAENPPAEHSIVQPTEYSATVEVTDHQYLSGEISSFGIDENTVWVNGGNAEIHDAKITRTSLESEGGAVADLYGVGACLLVTDGILTIENSTVSSSANGAAGVFSFGAGSASIRNCSISTSGNNSGGIHTAGDAQMTASGLTVSTLGEDSPAVCARGNTVSISGGTYNTYSINSPLIDAAGEIIADNTILTAAYSEAIRLRDNGNAQLSDCVISGSMQDQAENDCTWTAAFYSEASSGVDKHSCAFKMSGGTLISENGGVFYTTNTHSCITLENVSIITADDCEFFLRCTGNMSVLGWGDAGANGAGCVFTAVSQTMSGNIIYDTISDLSFRLRKGSMLSGAFIDNETCAGEGGNGTCCVSVDASSVWIVTDNSRVTSLESEGIIIDPDGNPVTVAGPNGDVFTEGNSQYVIIANTYSNVCASDNTDQPDSQ